MATTFQGGPGKVPAQRAGPTVARAATVASRSEVGGVLIEGGRRAGVSTRAGVGPRAVLALQRQAGNAAVGALMAAKLKSPGEQAVAEIDAALKEVRRDEPAIATVEKGLKAAKTAGVPVELEGPKPPASALAVTKTGFGPGQVPGKKPVPPPKPVPGASPLGKAGAAKTGGAGKGPAGGKIPAPAPAGGAAAPATLAPLALPADKLLQPPIAPIPVRPEDDPAFSQVTGNIKGFAQSRKAHHPAASKAKEAQAAALPPSDDVAGQAKAAKLDTMDAQPAGSFDKKAFIAAVKAAIEAKSPKTLQEADEYKKSGKAGEAKGQVKGLVTQGKEGQAKDIEAATGAPPDQSKAVPKPVTPMAQEQPGQAVNVPAAGAVPKPAPAEQVNLAAGTHQANQEMADAEVSEQQLEQSNEPEFKQGLADKQAAAEHAQTAPAEFRQQEQQVLQQGKAEAGAQTAAGVTGMQSAKATALANLVADKGKTKSKDEAKRAEVTAKVQGIFAAADADVKKILDGIDPKVEAAFEKGEAGARSAFEAYVEAKMSAYKKDRYGGWLGGYRWLRDKIAGMPPKVNEFYEAGRELYLQRMDGVISNVADIVGRALTAAKLRIARGKAEIASYAASLPASLQKVGAEASKEIGDKFSQLESDVNAKQESVVDALATKYVEARKGLDERIEALQAENKGLVDKAIGAIKAIINTIRELASMLKNVLSRAAGVVGDIIKNPVAFLGNLIEGVKGGILMFKEHILGHLKKGLMGWLFGALAEGGVELPDTFDVKGIIKLLASLFGLTWANIKNRIVKRIGAAAMDAVEKGVEIFQVLASQGVAGLWKMLVEKLGNIKDMILEQVKDFVITKIITAGITWLIGLLNPAAAFIKACKLIYDVVMFFVNNAERIMKFVNTIIDSVADIVRGNVSSVVNKINDVLGQMVPILIGFLASVIGIGGVGQKIRQIVETLQKPVNKALDFVIKTGLKLAGPIIRGLKSFGGKVKAKVAAGKAWVKGKVEAGKAWVTSKAKGTAAKIKDKAQRTAGRDDGAAAAKAVADVAVRNTDHRDLTERVHDAAVTAGNRHLSGRGSIEVSGVPSLQRTAVTVKEAPRSVPEAEQVGVRGGQPTNPKSAGEILVLIEKRMPSLLSEFVRAPNRSRRKLDGLQSRFEDFMKGRGRRALTKRERRDALKILKRARTLSRGYYGDFRDHAWRTLRADDELKDLIGAKGSKAKWGKGGKSGKSALRIEVLVTQADGRKLRPKYRSIDFEHLTRVTDQPFRQHSDPSGANRNLTPMLADLNRYFNEAVRNITGAHMFGSDEIERFIVMHQLYDKNSPAMRELGFQPVAAE
ncbi:hypothetical protein [Arthrobacter sp. ISL-5]|uniref:phage tail protein n=1 Tax=Arthrobacter sp. ISL-5 TaxID=2819111 RepID=UPI001BE720A5|nr:hypothetical protein [Arthrobacter sp. ISL-5]MBT2552007.1 hypothetical protein [Arthrobacter sp. ISL-5]